MKQLPMTQALSAKIKNAMGSDVDPQNFAVFETVSLNSKPLPGKGGTIWEGAVIPALTLSQMADYLNQGNHIPLIADHELMGAPKGRVFEGGVFYDNDNQPELRTLFFLDPTETETAAKLNAGSLDEVSVAFLSSAFLCSECGWDYFSQGSQENIDSRTCANGHTIGTDGTHAVMLGLNNFIEQSLVARGAADKPKIMGKSQAKLAPESALRLAAKGFDTNALVLHASLGVDEEDKMTDISALTAQLTNLSTEKGTLTANLSTVTTERDAARTDLATRTTERDAAVAEVTQLKADKAELEKRPDVAVAAEHTAAITFLHEQLDHLMVAKGDKPLEGEARLTKVDDLKGKIAELTNNLTSILPVGGRSKAAGGSEDDAAKLSYAPHEAFGVRR